MEVLTGLLIESWVLIVGFLGAYAWLIRLESRGVGNTKAIEEKDSLREKQIEELNVKRVADLKELEDRLMAQRAEDIQDRRDRDTAQEKIFKDIHDDIKELLQRTSRK